MLNTRLKDYVTSRVLPNVQTPGQYIGGELNSVSKDHSTVEGTVCLAFPDTYALGMSHHGLQVLYSLMNARGWANARRSFHPPARFEEAAAAEHDLLAFMASKPSRRSIASTCSDSRSSMRSATPTS